MLKKSFAALAASLGVIAAILPGIAGADDIDIFTGASAGKSINPRILIVLDNTSNWARQNQQWPGGEQQGQAEVDAIRTAIADLNDKVNVGVMEYVTDGTANDNGGFVRFHVQEMSDSAKALLGVQMQTIYNDINGPQEKRNSNTPYGNLMWDIYSYLAGGNSYRAGAGTNASRADPNGYVSRYSQFKTPLKADDTCAATVVIFIGNPNASGPASDTTANTDALRSLGGDTTQLGLPNFRSTTTTTTNKVGQTAACYASNTAAQAELPNFAAACAAYTQGCTIGSALNDGSATCPSGQASYAVIGTNQTITNEATGTTSTDNNPLNADEWVRFMHDKGIPVAGTTVKPKVRFYTIDVFNKQPNATHTSLLLSMARVGGGTYFAARNKQAIIDALNQILGEVLAVESTFASTSLPVNSTNRSQNENQVFIGMFRPDPNAKPRWFGNLKRYQIIQSGSEVDLGDVNGRPAVNPNTGFVTDCAVSYWTSPSGQYWQNLGLNPDPAGRCSAATAYSDSPDGPQVEKGAAAQVLRNGNNPPTTTDAPTHAVNRTIYTRSGTSLATFSTTSSGLSADLVDFIKGADVNNEKGNVATKATTRPSIHGDVIHSRPLPINYGDNGGVVVFYGANDGYLRAMEAETGKELWSFIAPEFFSRLQRLKDQTPLINYPKVSGTGDVAATGAQKDYFFDGSTGVYQNADNSNIWIFPTMRRGGRMLYALNVTNRTAPSLMWSAGCPNLGNDTGCTPGLEGIGQTWSTPALAFVKGHSETTPVMVVGGGYDNCEDANTGAPTCGASKGRQVYVFDASNGTKLASFTTERGVVGDISLVDIDLDGKSDYAYAADLGGNIYRIDFIDGPVTRNPLLPAQWAMYKVAFTSGGARKFLFNPALLHNKGYVYIAIGSGDREHPLGWQYPYDNVENRFYVTLDNLAVKDSTLARDLDTLTDNSGSTDCNSPSVLLGSNQKGWFMSLAQGEQVVTSAQIVGGTVLFSTNRPIKDNTASCKTALGEARGYIVSLFNASGAIGVDGFCGGTRSSTFVGGGLPPSPVLAQVPVNGRRQTIVIGSVRKKGGSGGGGGGGGGGDCSICTDKRPPAIKSVRKRSYTYVKGQ